MEYKVIAKEEIPPEESVATDRSKLYDLFKTLPFDQAICIKCSSWGDRQDKKTMISGISTKLRYSKDEPMSKESFKLVTQKKDEPLSDKRQAAYDRSTSKGTFKRVCYLYVWKEHLD